MSQAPNMNEESRESGPGLSYVVCTYKRPELMRNFFESFSRQLPDNGLWELIVVDNGGDPDTKDQTERFAEEFGGQIRYVCEPQTGLCYARNRGVAEARYSYLCLLDDDVTFTPGFIRESLSAISESEMDVVVPRIRCPIVDEWPDWLKNRVASGVGQYEGGPDTLELGSESKLPVGAAVIYRKSLHDSNGLFDVNLDRMGKKLFGGGETAFFKQAKLNGAAMVYEPKICVDHHLTKEKWSKSYWRRQGFYGGRSYVRMTNRFGKFGFGEFSRSTIKSVVWGARAILLFRNRFRSQYHMLAHLGRCYEYSVALFRY